ncbi:MULTISPECIES: hypothetical protein [unclassified Streptomyces]|uniref:hypothetical protein n=1 Tax=unclassified Streptomyces TaxID=2593676 RepID=UPI000804815B|nr:MULTISPECIES: hypothetical protein [unclassified Streptomyces]MYR73028.1 hypothetical protein [Streptomyces sp. SID4925]SBU95972.1 hypothetical protein YUMDRAFT_01641 [Streptomyces sp. OspMP-M45]
MSAPMTPDREQIRAELTAEFVAWLVKRAREHRVKGPQYAKQADVIGRLADKVSRGAVRPNNLLSLPPQGGPEDVVDLRAEVDRLRAEVSNLSDDVTGACLARYEEEQDADRLRLALASAQRGRRELRARVAELEAQAEKVAAFCAQRAEYVSSLRNCHPNNDHAYNRWTGHAEARRQLSQSLGLPVAWPAKGGVHPPHPAPCRHPASPDCTCPTPGAAS